LPTETLNGPEPDPVSEAYQQNDWKPIFIDSRFGLNQGAALLLARLHTIENQAIDPRPFKLDELSQSLDKLDRCRSTLKAADFGLKDSRAESLSDSAELLKKYQETFLAAGEADVRLTTAYFLFAKEMNPFLQKEEYLKALSGGVPLSKFLQDLAPDTFNYEALISAYARYKKLTAQGAQQRVGMTSKARHGESGNHIRDLQKRLQQEDFYSGNITGVYDAETQRAVKEFQAAHLIDPDGAVGQRTIEWLNVSFRQKSEMIALAIKAVRQSQTRTRSRFIRINIPQFMLEYYKDGRLQEAHKIVVGKASGKKVKFRGKMVGENQTPTLTGAIEQVILNPRWYVSDRIRLELDAAAKSDPEWFTKHGYVSMSSQYPWGAPRLFQSPGPKNALGRVKFEFPNPYAVYLHDTPLKHLFARSRRDFSHGCIRVDKALELAETLLRDDANPYAEKMKSVLTGSRQVFVKLSQPVLISVEYVPVVTNGSGQVVFAGDPYGILKENNSQKG
jgi:murein L,D-transpeptidase YcbB/YkuD